MNIVFENRQAYDDYLNDPNHEIFLKETANYVTPYTRVFDAYADQKSESLLPKQLVKELSAELSGSVLQPGDGRYAASIQIDNGRAQRRPGAIVLADNDKDVVQTLRFVIKNKLPLTIKGGGHSAAGYCLNDGGVVLDMMHLNGISFNKDN